MTVCRHKVYKVVGRWDWQMEKVVVQQSVSVQKQQKWRIFFDCDWFELLNVCAACVASHLNTVGDQSSVASSGCVTKR